MKLARVVGALLVLLLTLFALAPLAASRATATGQNLIPDVPNAGRVSASLLHDAARPVTSAAVTSGLAATTAAISADPAQVGQWSAPFSWPNVSVNTALLPTGKVLTFQDNQTPALWDPATNTFKAVPLSGNNIFCAGHTLLADGRVLVIGGYTTATGQLGIKDTYIFDPSSRLKIRGVAGAGQRR